LWQKVQLSSSLIPIFCKQLFVASRLCKNLQLKYISLELLVHALSPYLFILSVEILAEAICNKREITGIKIPDIEFKLSQYADDRTLIFDGSEESFKASLTLIESFGKLLGLS